MIPVTKTALDRCMVAPVRKRDRACPAQALQTASAFKHFRPINRNYQPNVLRLERFLLSDAQTFVPRSLTSVDTTYRHRGSSATPPSASLYRERIIYND